MPEPTPRKNCPACGATACFDATCSPEVVARADAFAALAPEGFFAVAMKGLPRGVFRSWSKELSAWARIRGLHAWSVANVLHAAARKYPRVKNALEAGDFSGWPDLDAALRLGGYEAMLDVVVAMIPERQA